MSDALNALLALKNDRRGVTAIEYGMIAALISVVIIATITTIGTSWRPHSPRLRAASKTASLGRERRPRDFLGRLA